MSLLPALRAPVGNFIGRKLISNVSCRHINPRSGKLWSLLELSSRHKQTPSEPGDPCKKSEPKTLKVDCKSKKVNPCTPKPPAPKITCEPKKKTTDPCASMKKVNPCKPKTANLHPCEPKKVASDPCATIRNLEPCKPKQMKVNPCEPKKILASDPCASLKKVDPCKSKKASVQPCEPKKVTSDPCASLRKFDPCKTNKIKINPCEPKKQTSDPVASLLQTDLCKPKMKKQDCVPKYKLRKGGCGRTGSTCTTDGKALSMKTVNPNLVQMQYAVRGPLVIRAGEIEKELKEAKKRSYGGIIRANIGDPQSMGQHPLTYFRQVMAGALYPHLLTMCVFPDDVNRRVCEVLKASSGGSVGAYTDSQGIEAFRRDVAKNIKNRDGFECDFKNVFLYAGASTGIKQVMKLLINKVCGKTTGVMIPIPQYPLYSASLSEYGLAQCPYYLDEDKNWALDVNELDRAYKEHSKKYAVRAIVVINPGNPTGQLLSRENIAKLLKFANDRHLLIFADEVYQHNIWAKGSKFYSFKKVLMENKSISKTVELASFMTISKGYFGECGLRGGWCELTNMDPGVQAELYKSASAMLCPPTIGQIGVSCVARIPRKGDPSYELFVKEREATLCSLRQRAKLIVDTFNRMEGFKCNQLQGALYAFPKFKLPPKAIQAAKKANQPPDVFYAFKLLEETGICIVPGSGFGQRPGTYHFRTTILPQIPLLKEMLTSFQKFHDGFTKKYT